MQETFQTILRVQTDNNLQLSLPYLIPDPSYPACQVTTEMAYLVATAMPTTEKVKVKIKINLNLNKLNLNGRTHSKVQGTDLATLTSISSGIFGQDEDRDVAGVHVAAREEGEAPARRVAVHVAPATARKGDARSGVTMAVVTARVMSP
jgi:hypothetical protein